MSEQPFRRVVLVCDAACDIHLAVAEAAALAARWKAALRGVFIDDENLHRFAALPFGRPVSLSGAAAQEELTATDMARLSSALGAGMRRALEEAAKTQGLEWTFGAIRDLPSAALVSAEEGDILVVEAASRTFSGAWRPRAAWEKSPAAFAGTVLIKGRGGGTTGILVLLPDDGEARERVLGASAALAGDDEEILLAGAEAVLNDADIARRRLLEPDQRVRIGAQPLADNDPSALRRFMQRRSPALIVVHAEAAAEWPEDTQADILLVR
jgi:hypothetical protein